MTAEGRKRKREKSGCQHNEEKQSEREKRARTHADNQGENEDRVGSVHGVIFAELENKLDEGRDRNQKPEDRRPDHRGLLFLEEDQNRIWFWRRRKEEKKKEKKKRKEESRKAMRGTGCGI